MNVVTQLTQFVGRDVINKNMTDLAVRCSAGSVELSCVAVNTPLVAARLQPSETAVSGCPAGCLSRSRTVSKRPHIWP